MGKVVIKLRMGEDVVNKAGQSCATVNGYTVTIGGESHDVSTWERLWDVLDILGVAASFDGIDNGVFAIFGREYSLDTREMMKVLKAATATMNRLNSTVEG